MRSRTRAFFFLGGEGAYSSIFIEGLEGETIHRGT